MKRFTMSPAEIMALSLRNSQMLAEAGMIVSMRMFGLAGMWRVPPAENMRMVSEKVDAAMQGAAAASRATARGATPAAIAEAALKPMRKRTAANRKRLTNLGPGKPT